MVRDDKELWLDQTAFLGQICDAGRWKLNESLVSLLSMEGFASFFSSMARGTTNPQELTRIGLLMRILRRSTFD